MVKSPVMACSPQLVQKKPHRLSIRLTREQRRVLKQVSVVYGASMGGVVEAAVDAILVRYVLGKRLDIPKDGRRK